eukprot:4152095-Prymnesium_polylepis.1
MGFAGLAVAFAYLWDLALVIMALSPVLVISMGMMVSAQSASAKATMAAYGEAGGQSSEVLAAIKTISSFCGEQVAVDRYEKALAPALVAGLRKVWKVGFTTSTFNSSMFYVLAVGLLYACLMSSRERVDTRFDFPPVFNPLPPFNGTSVSLCAPSCDPYNPAALVPLAGNCSTLASYQTFQMTCFTAQ